VERIRKDRDIEAIRGAEEFQELMKKLQNKTTSQAGVNQ